MTPTVTGEAERWRTRYEDSQFREKILQSEVTRLKAELEESNRWRASVEPQLGSRSWHLVEACGRLKWKLTRQLRQPTVLRQPVLKSSADDWDFRAHSERHLLMGRHSYMSPHVIVYPGDTGRVIVGNFCSIALGVEIFAGGNHTTHTVSTFPFRQQFGLAGVYTDGMPSTKGDVRIGNDVWVGKGATILSGVTVGDGAVIGARAVVSKDVRPFAIVVGNPAREVKRRFPDAIIDRLLTVAWWDWPDELIKETVDDLNGASVTDFLAKYGRG